MNARQLSRRVQSEHDPRSPLALLLGCQEAATLLGVSRSKFWQLHSLGRVPLPIRLSDRVVRWRKEELEAWVRAGCPPRDRWQARSLEK